MVVTGTSVWSYQKYATSNAEIKGRCSLPAMNLQRPQVKHSTLNSSLKISRRKSQPQIGQPNRTIDLFLLTIDDGP